jgi:hypothetical protein
MNANSSARFLQTARGQLLLLLLLLGGTLSALCYEGFLPHHVFWANDAALGAMKESSARLPGTFFGYWSDFWWIGGAAPSSSPSLSTIFAAILSPELYLKIYAPLTMAFMGFCAWFFFRQLRFAPIVCVIGGLGAGLNMHFFSNACWGLGTWEVSAAMVFVALGILVSPDIPQLWVKAVLAGFSVGMVVMEGFDVGAIFSIYVGIFLLFFFLTSDSSPARGIVKATGAGAIVVICAVLMSASTLYTLVGTQLTGTAGNGQTAQEKVAQYDFNTQWSIPKLESFRVFIPGLFGYRLMDYTTSTNKSGSYWGSIAEDPRVERLESSDPKVRAHAAEALGVQAEIRNILAGDDVNARKQIIDQIKSNVQRRHTGSGEYAGLLVCLLAVFGLANSIRKTHSPYSSQERWSIWFWGVAGLFSLMAAWGQHGFVYRLVYAMPFLNNIRSPMKFMHPLNIILMILSGYGLEALHRRYMEAPSKGKNFGRALVEGMKKFSGFETKWAIGSLIVFAASVAALLIYSGSRANIISYLEHNGFGERDGFGKEVARGIAAFSIGEFGLFLVCFTISGALIVSILTGAFAGRKAVIAWAGLCAIMIGDLYRADLPWVRYYNYTEKYSMNPVVDFLRKDTWDHRVVSRISPNLPGYDIVPDGNWAKLCHWWLENDYPYNDIQSLEIDQGPRLPLLDKTYIGNFTTRSANDLSPSAVQWASTHPRENNPYWNWVVQAGPAARLWRLTNTRYIFADARFADTLNQFAEPPGSFRILMRADLTAKPGVKQIEDFGDVTVQTNAQGPMALIEFTDALPRTKLYSDWRVMDDATTLQTLASREFDPKKTVLVAQSTPASQTPVAPGADAGAAKITKYESKDLLVETNAKTSAILLLNDRTGNDWTVSVDQKPAELLRCNYIMRGVFVPPGVHTVEFRFQPPLKFLYVSVAAFAFCILLASHVIYTRFWGDPDPPNRGPGKWTGSRPATA